MSNRPCDICKELIDIELDGDKLEAAKRDELMAHLDACAAWRPLQLDLR